MTRGRRDALVLVAAGIAAAAAGVVVGPVFFRSDQAGEALLAASLVDLTGKRRKLTEWQGGILVCNFWATWCAPCREEIPLLMAVRREYGPIGVEIIGIALDSAAKVGEFTRTFEISYPILLAESDGLDLMRGLGNSSGGLPYTVVVDRRGAIATRKLGALKHGELDAILEFLARS